MARSCLCRRDLLVFVLALWFGASVVASFSLPQVTISPFGSDETGSGSSSNPFKTLSKAISVLEPGGTVWMASGVYSGDDNFISQSDAMTIRSVDPTSPAVLACVGGYSGHLNLAENFTASDIIFAGCETIVTIQYPATYNFVNCIFNNLGSANECEGGIAMIPSPGIYMWFENCTFVNNSLAVFMTDGNATFVGCTFQNNQVAVTVTPGTAVFENCLFQNNTGGMGSDCLFTPDWGVAQSVLNNNGVMRISNCSFESNSSPGNGGAVLNDDGILLVSDSQFVSNTAGEGGALYLSSASILKAQNVLFMNNTATSLAGAIGCDSSGDTVTLTSCQSTNNSPPDNCPENSFL